MSRRKKNRKHLLKARNRAQRTIEKANSRAVAKRSKAVEKQAADSPKKLESVGDSQAGSSAPHDHEGLCVECGGYTEFEFKFVDRWSTALFIEYVRSRGIEPFRTKGQRKTTVKIALSEKEWAAYAADWVCLEKRLFKGFLEVMEDLRSEFTEEARVKETAGIIGSHDRRHSHS
jgi:hypothetical protein